MNTEELNEKMEKMCSEAIAFLQVSGARAVAVFVLIPDVSQGPDKFATRVQGANLNAEGWGTLKGMAENMQKRMAAMEGRN